MLLKKWLSCNLNPGCKAYAYPVGYGLLWGRTWAGGPGKRIRDTVGFFKSREQCVSGSLAIPTPSFSNIFPVSSLIKRSLCLYMGLFTLYLYIKL